MEEKELSKLEDDLYHARITKDAIAKRAKVTNPAVTKWFQGIFQSIPIEKAAVELLEEYNQTQGK